MKQEGPAYLSGTSEFIPGFSGVHVAQSLVFCVLYCRSLFVLSPLIFVLSVLRLTGGPGGSMS